MATEIWRHPITGAVFEVDRNGLTKKWITSNEQLELLITNFGVPYKGDLSPVLLDARETIGFGSAAEDRDKGLVLSLEELETNVGALMAILGGKAA